MLHYCQYYRGEATNPYTAAPLLQLWECERFWAQAGETNNVDTLRFYLRTYLESGLGIFLIDDPTPITLKAALFHHYCQIHSLPPIEAADPFKTFYQLHYTK